MKEENNRLKILFESVKNKIDHLSSADNCLDGKAATLIGIEIALMTGYSAFISVPIIIDNLGGKSLCASMSGLLLLIVSVIFLLIVTHPKKYPTISVNLEQYSEYLKKPEKDLLLQLISDAQHAFTNNNSILEKKVLLYRWAVYFFIAASFLLVLPFILSLII